MKEIKHHPNQGASLPRLRTLAGAVAAVVCGLAVGPLQAQGIAAPELDWQPNPDADVILLKGNLNVTHDSNLLRVDNNYRPANYASRKAGDLYLNGGMGIEFDRLISQQRLRALAEVEGFKYQEYDDFDHVAYRAGATLDWVVGRPLFGSAGVNLSRQQPTIQDRALNQTTNPNGDRNDIDTQLLFFNAGFRMTPSWSAIAGVDLERTRNTLEVYKDTDYDRKGAEAGVRYSPGTGVEVDVVYRRINGDFKSAQRYDDNGVALLCAADTCRENDYKENILLSRIQYRPSDDSRLAGHVGYTKREQDSGRADFGGLTMGFDVEWAYSGNVQMRVALARSIDPDNEALTASYVDTYSINLQPVIQATGKIAVSPYFRHYNRRFKEEDLSDGHAPRKDKLTYFGVETEYEFRRNMTFMLNLGHEKRDSNHGTISYTSNVIGAGLKVQF